MVLTETFFRYDKNKDGKLGNGELRDLVTEIHRASHDLWYEEYQRYKERNASMGAVGGIMFKMTEEIVKESIEILIEEYTDEANLSELRAKFDSNIDGAIDKEEFLARCEEILFTPRTMKILKTGRAAILPNGMAQQAQDGKQIGVC